MTPIAIVKYIVERLEGTPYEPWINGLLFSLLAAAVAAAISLLLGSKGRTALTASLVCLGAKIAGRKGYAPEWEAFRLRVEPYIELASSLYFAFVGLYSATIVGLAFVIAYAYAAKPIPWWAPCLVTLWVLASFAYMRICLEAASWAHHRIKLRRA